MKWIKRIVIFLILFIVVIFWRLFLTERPPLTIDPATLAGDGSTLNYCELPVLDGNGLRAADIPKGNTPGCSYSHFPLPILRDCREPLPPEADDIRGLWLGIEGRHVGHVERVEQCGSRVVVTTSGIIHDSGPNSTAGLETNDTEGVVFRIAGKPFCPRTSALMEWEDGVLLFKVFGANVVAVKRYRDGEHLIWEYIDGSTTRMKRICTLPPEHKIPNR